MFDILANYGPLIVFCVIIHLAILFLRKVMEHYFPNIKNNFWWNELILPFSPPGLGGVLAWLVPYPFPAVFSTLAAKIFLGVFCGLVCGWVFRFVKKTMQQKLQVDGNVPDKLE